MQLSEREIIRLKNNFDDYYRTGGITPSSGCHTWNLSKNKGYGKLNVNITLASGDRITKTVQAHTYIFKLNNTHFNLLTRIPGGLQVSHLCGKKDCVRLSHLNLETAKINSNRRPCHSQGFCNSHDGYPDCMYPTS